MNKNCGGSCFYVLMACEKWRGGALQFRTHFPSDQRPQINVRGGELLRGGDIAALARSISDECTRNLAAFRAPLFAAMRGPGNRQV